MSALEKVMQMKRQGLNENQIIRALQNEGVSPKEISDALTHSQIKQAVSQQNEQMESQEMQNSITNQERTYDPEIPLPVPQPSEQNMYYPPSDTQNQENYFQSSQNQQETPQYSDQEYSQQPQETYAEEYYPQDNYPQEEYYQGGMDNIIEIAEQVFSEKTKKIKDQLDDFAQIKTLLTTKIENIEERLKRIEKMFDHMQISIIEKVGSYGKGLDTMKKELEMVEDSFSKIVNKVVENKSSSHKKK